MGFFDCCSAFLTNLPDPAVPLLPSLFLGTSFASVILLCLYKKETNLPLRDILFHAARNVFCSLPDNSEGAAGHSDSERCDSVECVRCKRHEVLRQQVRARWRTWKKGKVDLGPLKRVEEAVSRLEKGRQGEKLEGKEEGKLKEESEGKVKNRGKGSKVSPPSKNKKGGGNKESSGKAESPQSSQSPTIFHMELAANPNWTDFEVHTNDQKLLKLNLEIIQKEFGVVFDALKSGDNSGWKNNNIPQGHWCIFPFVNQGKIVAQNCRRCPGVAELVLGCLPAMMNDCVFGNAAFSILYPNSHITPHCGPTNLRLRCHLGLRVPPECWLEVAGQQHRWGVGKTLLFDDSFTHSAYFGSRPSAAQCEPRAVLLLDFWHPDVSDEEKVCLLDLLAPLD